MDKNRDFVKISAATHILHLQQEKTRVSLITLTKAPLYSSVPVDHDGVTVRQHDTLTGATELIQGEGAVSQAHAAHGHTVLRSCAVSYQLSFFSLYFDSRSQRSSLW